MAQTQQYLMIKKMIHKVIQMKKRKVHHLMVEVEAEEDLEVEEEEEAEILMVIIIDKIIIII